MKRYFLSCTTQKIGDGVKLGAKSFTDQGQITRSDGSPAVITRNLSFAETDRLADAIDSHPGFRGEKLEDAMDFEIGAFGVEHGENCIAENRLAISGQTTDRIVDFLKVAAENSGNETGLQGREIIEARVRHCLLR